MVLLWSKQFLCFESARVFASACFKKNTNCFMVGSIFLSELFSNYDAGFVNQFNSINEVEIKIFVEFYKHVHK